MDYHQQKTVREIGLFFKQLSDSELGHHLTYPYSPRETRVTVIRNGNGARLFV